MAEPALDLGRFRAKLRDRSGATALAGLRPAPRRPARGAPWGCSTTSVTSSSTSTASIAGRTGPRAALGDLDLLTALLHTWSKVRLLRVEPRLAILVHQLRTNL